jgi:hypothetical protein
VSQRKPKDNQEQANMATGSKANDGRTNAAEGGAGRPSGDPTLAGARWRGRNIAPDMADTSKSNVARFTTGLRRIGQRGATSKTYAGWHEFAKAATPYALFRTDGDAALFAAAPALFEATVEDDALAVAIEATLRSVAVPSGCPEVSRAFADIRGMLQATTAKRRSALAQARGEA